MKQKRAYLKTVAVQIEDTTREQFELIAREERRSLSNVLRNALTDYLDHVRPKLSHQSEQQNNQVSG